MPSSVSYKPAPPASSGLPNSPSQSTVNPTPRSSTRVTPLRRPSAMTTTPSDCQRSIRADSESSVEVRPVQQKGKRCRSNSETEDEGNQSVSAASRSRAPKKNASQSQATESKTKRPKKTMVTLKDAEHHKSNSLPSPGPSKQQRIQVNLTQNSEDEHDKVRSKSTTTKNCHTSHLTSQPDDDEPKVIYDPIKDYFGDSFQGAKDANEGPWNLFNCKYCGVKVRGGGSSPTNMLAHRDGSRQDGKSGRPGCKQRAKATAAGCVLPPTVFEEREKERELARNSTTTQVKVDAYVNKGYSRFSNSVSNQMVGLWAIQTSQPWLRIEDEALCACFRYSNPAAQLFDRTWLSTFAHKAYLGMRSSVISELQALDSKFGLILDAWTSPRNKYGFISASVTYINSEWKYVTRHLSMKMIAWDHKGEWLAEPLINVLVKHKLYSKMLAQTHDSGSNNDTCARAMQARLSKVDTEQLKTFEFDESRD